MSRKFGEMTVKSPQTILICCLRLMGDVLVTTPLALSLKSAFPDAQIDYLVFAGTDKVLLKNPHIRRVITVPPREKSVLKILSLFRKYDLAVGAYPSDRTALVTAVAGKRTIGLRYGQKKEWWKDYVLSRACLCDDRLHVVHAMLALARGLGIPPIPRVVMGCDDDDRAFARTALPLDRYVILHPYSMNRAKYWSAEKWARLALLIRTESDCEAVFTRTPEPEGDEYLAAIKSAAPTGLRSFDAPCTLSQLSAIIRNSVAYVGIDTAVTHIAAAVEVPTFALFGPTLTRYWAPWPNDGVDQSPFSANRGIQNKGYVTVIQKDWPCVPCNDKTCSLSSSSRMECLEQLTPEEVFAQMSGVLIGSRAVN